MEKLKQQKNTGFTLLEMIVAIGVFMVVVTISLSAFLNVHDIQLKMSAFRAANDSVNFAIETIVRDIEEGRCTKQDNTGTCSVGISSIDFYTFDNNQINYQKSTCGTPPDDYGCIKRNGTDITSDNVNITYLNFDVINKDPDVYDSSGVYIDGDNAQPLVTITVEGESGVKEKLKSKINVQASVSMRQLDVVYTP